MKYSKLLQKLIVNQHNFKTSKIYCFILNYIFLYLSLGSVRFKKKYILMLIRNVSSAPNHHIRMISEESCVTENSAAENSACHHRNKLHFKNIKTHTHCVFLRVTALRNA